MASHEDDGNVNTLPRAGRGQPHDNVDALARCRARFRTLRQQNPPSGRLKLHAYTINSLGWWHTSVSLFGIEWSFDGYQNAFEEQWQQRTNSLKGVQSSTLEPHEAMSWFMGGRPVYREHDLGATSKSLDEVQAILEHLIQHDYHAGWAGTDKTYTLFSRQCQDFAQHFLCYLLEPTVHAALIPAELLSTRDVTRYQLHPSAWLARRPAERPTIVHNETGSTLLLDIYGPVLLWMPYGLFDGGIRLEHGSSWTEEMPCRTLRFRNAASKEAGGEQAIFYEAPCQGQHIRLLMDESGGARHENLMRLEPNAWPNAGVPDLL